MIESHGLARNLPRTPPRQRRDHGAELNLLRRKGDCGQCDCWVADRILPSNLDMIPNEEAVPSCVLGVACELRHRSRVRIWSKVGQINCKAHMRQGSQFI